MPRPSTAHRICAAPARRLARVVTAALVAAAIALAGPAHAAERWKSLSPAEMYEYGEKQLRRGYFDRALVVFNHLRNFHRDDPVSLRAELAVADVYFKQREYEQARLAYEDFARLHPRASDLDYVVFRTGLSVYKRAPRIAARDQTATWQAVNTWTGFEVRFPESEHVGDVEDYLAACRDRLAAKELHVARFYARDQKWLAVRRRAESALRQYPESRHAPEALLLLGTAHHAWGRVDDAQAARERLAESWPEAPELEQLDRQLARPPGRPPEEEVFVRPYRVPNATGPQGM